MDARTYREETRYDGYGRAWKTRDASGGWLKQQFDARGFATRLCDSTEADTAPSCGAQFYTTVDEVDARGAVLVERRGSSVGPTIARSYNALNGQLTGVCTGSGCTVQNSAYGYDNKGQLTSREEAGRYKERFQYDGADRLTLGWFEYLGTTWYSASAPYVNPDAAAPANLSFYAQYDKLGNICRKYQFGLFAQYGYAGRAGCGTAGNPGSGSGSATLSAHQTQSLFIPGLITIANQHDARGNMTSADSLRFYEYNALNQATEVRRVASVGSSDITIRARFAYGADGARYRRIDDGSSAGGTTTTTIIGAVERVQKPGGAIQWRRTVGGVAIVSYSGDQLVGGITQAAGAGTVRHQFTDRLGSVQVIGLVNGSSVTVQERLDGGADGQWRTPDPPFGQAGSSHTPRGFTGHEHLEGHDTIHMNGRLYWPTGGRMVQADPIITDIYNPQNWNPYSYVLNNPLNLTDPSGYSFLSKYWRTIAAIVVTVYTGGLAAGAATSWAAAGWSIGGGFVAGAIQTNSLRGGIYGAFSAGIFNKIGIAYQGATGVKAAQGVLAHAAAGGVMSSLQGGKFGHGFVSAGFTQALSPGIGKLEGPIRQGTAVAVLGGTTSVMTGGKFGNGAVTAAFSYAFGRAASGAGSGNVNDTSPSPPPVIESGGDVTILEEALGMLPPDVLAELNRAGISYVAVGESVTEYLTHLRGVAPRGWGSGATWDSVPGGFDANTKSVIVATRGAHSHGSVNMALHEIGHAYDFSTGYPSRSTEFHISYGVDRRNLRSYYLQPGMAGRSEAFAESFAGYFSRNQEYMNRHPALTNYWSSRRRP